MKKNTARRKIEVNLEELDGIIDHGTFAPLSESDGKRIKAARRYLCGRNQSHHPACHAPVQ
jgi:hypothetical protein